MISLPIDPLILTTYVATASLLVLAPGPGQALVVARSLASGTRAGVMTSIGLEIGTLVHTLAAALGLSIVLATSATAFSLVKYGGALYLIVLGILTVRRAGRASGTDAPTVADAVSGGDAAWVVHGAVAGILNPKVALFFLAFLPQFVQPERGSVFFQFLVLGAILSLLGLLWDALLAFSVGRARNRIAGNPRFVAWRERITGAVLIGLGLRLALLERR